MKRTLIASIFMAVFLFVSACASHRYTVIEPRKKELTDYRILEIKDFKCNLGDRESKELAARFADKLHQNIMKNRWEHPDKVIFDDVVRGTDKIDGVLLLDGAVISFEKGSRAKRYFLGFGAGKSYCTIQSIFTDKMTNEPILKINFDGELSMGLFGGSADEAVQGVVEAYLDYFDDYFENLGENLGKEDQKLASIPKSLKIDILTLRSRREKDLNETKIKDALSKYGFFDSKLNPAGSFDNDLIDNQNGTITDKATLLMWQKSGSEHPLRENSSLVYVKKINNKRFAGYSDWRLPTIEELASLLKRDKSYGFHLDPVFEKKQKFCWSSDRRVNPNIGKNRCEGWVINFEKGQVTKARWSNDQYVIQRGFERGFNTHNYVRAVRSVK